MIDREKVARAIAETYHGKPISDQYLTGAATGGRVWLTAADAAIAAVLEQLREPSEAMIEAGFRARNRHMTMAQSAAATWEAMLEAFLQPQDSSNPAE